MGVGPWYPLWRGDQAFYKVDIAEGVSRLTRQRFIDANEPMQCDFAGVDGVVRGLARTHGEEIRAMALRVRT